ncbi:NAD(P)/FAD-dependent oxidoreductase [Phenylobacterium sp. LH3H17]|uniref:flavin-containing monooxygenase n=1 Tax=Phenylobacterium sp. LH3H17 TaxID=2903901 RepID=UPI0020CA22CD|nr:NAD(P)/FAD-dependent oxidoreductase [Phenylobacterium sp. LH3H17]UTP37760.1 NAD(P)/FAD-dependent oxidoreductase [Phenylobacterium sp. LH3H17]
MADSVDVETRTDLGFDPEALRAKYRAERDKRLRADGNQQYQEIVGDFAHYLDDPYVEPGFSREPLTDEVEVVVIGGGFGGLLAGARLREAGVKDIRLIEKGGDFGGTWYWNRYPGAACDVESYIYLPLLEEVGYMPAEKYSRAPEILAHSRAIGTKYDLYSNACFQTEVTGMVWEESTSRWIISTNRGDRMKARFVAMANGPLHRPKLPGIPGVETFKGHSFHTSRWDYAYTGGDSNGGLTGLAGKRVGIIGTGATAVQCVPHLGAAAGELYVFQRTPSSIDVRNNRPTDPDWAGSLEPGWQQSRMDNFNTLVTGGFAEQDLVNDGWTDIIRNLGLIARKRAGDGGQGTPDDPAALVQLADFQKMEQIRGRVDSVVRDGSVAEALKPYYNQFCKRPCFHDEYLATFNRPNVTLVDTQGRGVERITERGVVVDGREYELDCLIYATGFEVGTDYTRRSGYELHGRDGLTLTEKWRDGLSTLHGMHVRGFPNCFVFSNSQSGFTVNFPHMMNEQSKHLAYIVKHCLDHQVRTVETSEAAETEWVETIISTAILRQKFAEECTPGYYNNEGKPSASAVRNGPYGKGPIAFTKLLEEWRADGGLPGLELRTSV